MAASIMLNIGCGASYHSDWINLDVVSADSSVLSVDIANGLPFSSGFANVCYSSHVLEHFDINGARNLVAECFRVLKSGGVVRLVVPDLEALVRAYLQTLDAVASGEDTRELDYDWLMLELYDQAVRNSSGGEMARFLKNLDEKQREFVRIRIGAEAEKLWASDKDISHKRGLESIKNLLRSGSLLYRVRVKIAGWLVYLVAGNAALRSYRMGIFRSGGEVHQWMYDRYSVKRLLEQVGFADMKICTAYESRIPEFEKYALDVSNGVARKPDSLYVEASKP